MDASTRSSRDESCGPVPQGNVWQAELLGEVNRSPGSILDRRRHPKDVIAERNIRLPWLEQVLESPELVEPDRDDPELTHYVARIKEHGNRALRVVFNKSVNPVRIVTVYFDRGMKGRL
ncbi:MAG: DUF4258 domain-containing protein [Chthoniobacterales bacterium]